MFDPERASIVELVARILCVREGPRSLGRATVAAARLLDETLDESGKLAPLARADPSALAARLASCRHAHATRAGPALAAAFELGRRVAIEEALAPPRFENGAHVAAWATPRLAALVHEELWVLALDGRSHLRAARLV